MTWRERGKKELEMVGKKQQDNQQTSQTHSFTWEPTQKTQTIATSNLKYNIQTTKM